FSISIRNDETSTYTGTLKVYLAEIIATDYTDYSGKPYHNAFLEFLLDESITVNANSKIWVNDSFDVSSLDPDNLMIYAVVFNSESTTKYSNPPDGKSFTAYYADDADMAIVIKGGDLPPSVGFTNPKEGKIHLFGNILIKTFTFNKTMLLGRTTITASASHPDGLNITKVEFYFDDELVQTFNEPPYEWELTGPSIFQFRHTIKAIVYDENGKTNSDEDQLIAFILLGNN
ncbi:MAG: hypothetical protein KAR20_14250, partial [Candidatus Heimdallarchaeota archaeon]|nr:hypothetical protein [Candidatus Heimdallarchaeota archaeon]